MTLRGEIIDLLRSHFLNEANQVRAIREIAIMKMKSRVTLMRILIKMIYSVDIK